MFSTGTIIQSCSTDRVVDRLFLGGGLSHAEGHILGERAKHVSDVDDGFVNGTTAIDMFVLPS
jgi:hypothetical protein